MSKLSKAIIPEHVVPDQAVWRGPDCAKNLRELKEQQSRAVANTPPAPLNDQPDPFTRCAQLEARNRELEALVETLRAELAKKGAPHLKQELR